jgi:mannose-6-phosphate isomerase
VANPLATAEASPQPPLKDGEAKTVVQCEYFTLDLMIGESQSITLNTHGDSFHAISITGGAAKVEGDGWSFNLKRFESSVVPASCGEYAIHPQGSYRALKSSVAY